jgi:hypothetical protein
MTATSVDLIMHSLLFVPKWGKLAGHFLNHSLEFASQYHNTIFDHGDTLSQEALFSQFAWAALKLVVEMTHQKGFKFVDIPKDLDPNIKDERGGGKGEEDHISRNIMVGRRKVLKDSTNQSGTYQPGRQAHR